MKISPVPGMLAYVRAGRDEGRAVIIKEIIDSDFVMIVDGEMRKLDSAKKKKIKHLKLSPKQDFALQKAFQEGIIINDADVRKAIEKLTGTSEF